jgi:hypothetical protein
LEKEESVERPENLTTAGDAGRPNHPARAEITRFMLGELADGGRVVRHLLTGCPQCTAMTRRLWNLGEEAPAGPGFLRIERGRERHGGQRI